MITLLNSKIEEEIVNDFEENYEPNQEDYVCEFIFDEAEILVPYSLIHDVITYKNEWIGATKYGVNYTTEDTEHFEIRRKGQNPNKRTLQQEIDSIIEHEERKIEENKKSSEAIREHNEYLDLNER